VLGATAVIRFAKPGHASPWLLSLLARKPKKLAAIALANKMARTLWAMMVSGEVYRQPLRPKKLARRILTWHLQGQQQDGDRSNRGSEHPGKPFGA
jgi:hypothetical protein